MNTLQQQQLKARKEYTDRFSEIIERLPDGSVIAKSVSEEVLVFLDTIVEDSFKAGYKQGRKDLLEILSKYDNATFMYKKNGTVVSFYITDFINSLSSEKKGVK